MPIINRGDDYFQAGTYTGNGTSQTITGLRFRPDFVWIKARSTTGDHGLFDAVRGSTKILNSNTTDGEGTRVNSITSFNSDGFSIGSDSSVNTNGTTYVYWAWKANGTGVTNTAGTITSTVSANTTSGFSIVTWTAGSAAATIGHGLGVAPAMIITKNRTQGGVGYNWAVYHKSLASASQFLDLNLTNAVATNTGIWNATAPTSTVFSVGTARTLNNDLNVAYCFAPVAGFSAFGSYTGNGSTDGPMIWTGMRPRYVLLKASSGTSAGSTDWEVHDTARDTSNASVYRLYPNRSVVEDAVNGNIDILSNGFKIRNADSRYNENGTTYIYAAFAEVPYKFALGR